MDQLFKGEGRTTSFSKLESGENLYTVASVGGGDGGGARYDGGDGGGGAGDGAQPSGSSSGWRALLAWYMSKLEERPVQPKALTAGVLNLLGDLISQLLVEKNDHYDLKRSAIFFLIGLGLVGPVFHYWYLALSRVVRLNGSAGAGVRLVFDQVFFAPVFIASFFCALLTLDGRPSDIGAKLKQDWPSVVVTNWNIWVPFQFFNFLLVPQPLQVMAKSEGRKLHVWIAINEVEGAENKAEILQNLSDFGFTANIDRLPKISGMDVVEMALWAQENAKALPIGAQGLQGLQKWAKRKRKTETVEKDLVSKAEEEYMEALLGTYVMGIDEAEAFSERLKRELSAVEAANVYANLEGGLAKIFSALLRFFSNVIWQHQVSKIWMNALEYSMSK